MGGGNKEAHQCRVHPGMFGGHDHRWPRTGLRTRMNEDSWLMNEDSWLSPSPFLYMHVGNIALYS